MYKIEEIKALIQEGDDLALDRLAQKQNKYLAAIAKALLNLLEKEDRNEKTKRKTRDRTAKSTGKKRRGDTRGAAVVL